MIDNDCEIDLEEAWVLDNLYREDYDFLDKKQNRNTTHAKYAQASLQGHIDRYFLTLENWDPLKEMRAEKMIYGKKSSWMNHQAVAEIIYKMRGFNSR